LGIGRKDVRRPKEAEMKFMKSTAGYKFLDQRRNCILEELKLNLIENQLAQTKQKLLTHMNRMEDITQTNMLKRRSGRPLNRQIFEQDNNKKNTKRNKTPG
jgi:hypothetical protein